MEPPSPPDPIPVTTTEKITAAAKLAALLAKEILGKEMQSDAVRCSLPFMWLSLTTRILHKPVSHYKRIQDAWGSQGNWGKAENEEGTSVIIFWLL
jgi:hypothetical protein